MLVNLADILKYIPQRPPIVVVHGLVSYADNLSISEFSVEEDHLFVRDGKLLESGLMENIAQTCALSSGYGFAAKATKDGEMKPPIGFIGGLKNFNIIKLPKVGDMLQTTITILHEVMGMQVVEAKVSVDEDTIAECEIKIFLSNEN